MRLKWFLISSAGLPTRPRPTFSWSVLVIQFVTRLARLTCYARLQVFATQDPSKGYKGISCFVVEKDMGVEIAKKEKKVSQAPAWSTRQQDADLSGVQLGIRASSTCTLNFDEVKVPAENLMGEEGQGYKYAIEILNEGRVGIAGQMVGLAQGAFNKSVPYTFQRKQFGQAVGNVRTHGTQTLSIP